MSQPPIAAKVHQAFYIHRDFPAQIALDPKLGDCSTNSLRFVVRQISHFFAGINLIGTAYRFGRRQPNAVNLRQRNSNVFLYG